MRFNGKKRINKKNLKTLSFATCLIRLYQTIVSPFTRRRCRFYPTCSEYCFLLFKKHNFIKASCLCFWRILRCGPWSQGGIDKP